MCGVGRKAVKGVRTQMAMIQFLAGYLTPFKALAVKVVTLVVSVVRHVNF